MPNLLRSPVRPVLGPVVQSLVHARSKGGGGFLVPLTDPDEDANAVFQAAWAEHNTIRLEPGTYYADAFEVPPGKWIVGANMHGSILKINDDSLATTALTPGEGCTIRSLRVDANVPAREALGFDQYTHGISGENCSNVTIKSVSVRNWGETADYTALNTGAIVAYMKATATSNMTGWRISAVDLNDETGIAPYGIRIATEFIGYARGEIGYSSFGHVIDGFTIVGTTKNAIELAGPDLDAGLGNYAVHCRNGTITEMLGQGGAETDYGGSAWFENITISRPGIDAVAQRSLSAFAARNSDQGDSKLKVGRATKFTNCSFEDAESNGSFVMQGWQIIGHDNVVIENCSADDLRRGSNSQDDRITVVEVDTSYADVHNLQLTDNDLLSGDAGVRYYGSGTLDGLAISGGTIATRKWGYRKAGTDTGAANIAIDGADITAVDPLSCNNEDVGVLTVTSSALRGVKITLPSTPANAAISDTLIELQPYGEGVLLAANPALSGDGNTFATFDYADAYFLRCFSVPPAGAETAIRAFFAALSSASALTNLDGVINALSWDKDSAQRNLMQDRFGASDGGTGGTWAAYIGLSDCDTTNRWVIGFNASTASAAQFAQSSAFMALLGLDDNATSNRFGANNSRCYTTTNANMNTRANDTTNTTSDQFPYETVWWDREASGSYHRGYDDAKLSDVAVASTGFTNANFEIGAVGGLGSSGSAGNQRIAAWGGGLGDTKRAAVVTALRNLSSDMRALA